MFRKAGAVRWIVLGWLVVAGCRLGGKCDFASDQSDLLALQQIAAETRYTDVATSAGHAAPLAPRTVADAPPTDYWDLPLAEAIEIALRNGRVLKDLQGRVVTYPDSATTVFDPAIRESDPLFGMQAALSAFDTRWNTRLFWAKNDRLVNNAVIEGGALQLRQDLANFSSELSQTAITGTQVALRNLTQYDANNRAANLFPSAWDTQFEAVVRQPLLRGAGIRFNEIAGPNAQPGFRYSTGVLIARVNNDIGLAEFEIGVRAFLSDIESAYWELAFAYRDWESKRGGRDAALEIWQHVSAKLQQGLPGGEADKEAQAREQFFQFEEDVRDALNAIYRDERRLRTLLGLPGNDGRLVRPRDEPPGMFVVYDWHESLAEALVSRAELRRQKWRITRREMELVAAHNFLKPRLDVVGLYRYRGFGDDLMGSSQPLASAFHDLGTGDHQEWQLGFEFETWLGQRQGHAAVRNAELQLARERALLEEQERIVSNELGNAIGEVTRAHYAVQTGFNRLAAAQARVEATQAAFQINQASLDLLLEAQARLALAQSRYHRSLTQYALALKDVHVQKGTLLQFDGVALCEGQWPDLACQETLLRLSGGGSLDYRLARPVPLPSTRVTR